jgi:hypothetical protein
MKKIKDFIKKNPEPSRGTNYVNPSQLGQYSASNHVSEDSSLDTYLSSKGIDPTSLSRETKSGHARSNEFSKWKKNRVDEDLTVGKSSETDIRSKLSQSPTRRRASKLKSAMGHYKIKSVTTHMPLHKETSDPCWSGYKQYGMKTKNGKQVPNCVPVKKEGNQMAQITPEEVKTYMKVCEDTFADNKAATQTVMSPGEISEKKKKKTLSSFREDMHDWEKEDKSVKTYGKKPNHEKTDEKENSGENKPSARSIMSGGTTLTDEKRDVVEIDPAMRNRPGQPDITKKDDKKKDEKKEEKKDNKKDK